MLRVVVFDTNILLSALLSVQGSPFRCVALAKAGTIESVTCQEILDEFEEKLRDKFAYAPERARAASAEVRAFSHVVTITNTLHVVTADPDDDKVVECALIGGATHIVTGDRRHLLPLATYRNVTITSVGDFLALVAGSQGSP